MWKLFYTTSHSNFHLHKGSQRHWAKQSLSKCVTLSVNSWERQRRAAVMVFLSLFVARLRFILRFWRRWQEFYWFLDKILWFTVWNQNLQNDEFTLYSTTWVINKFIFECFFEDISPFCGAADALFWTAHYVCLQWRIQDSQRRWQPEGGGANLLFDINFAENCVKMKKNWTVKKGRPWHSH